MPDRLSDVILCIANGVELGYQNVSARRWDVNAWIPPMPIGVIPKSLCPSGEIFSVSEVTLTLQVNLD